MIPGMQPSVLPAINVEVKDPIHGAAYRVLFERTFPHYCTTREGKDEIAQEFDQVLTWAQTQSPKILEAYQWAAKEILQSIEKRLTVNNFSNSVAKAFENIPKPP